MLLHGFAQTPESWSEVAAALPDDFELQIPELPGHGRTGFSLGEPSVELARSVVRGAVERCIDAPVIWGYSQGARIAFDFLLAHPGSARGAIIESGAPGIEDPVTRAERRSRDFAMSMRLEAGTIEEFVAMWELVPALGRQSREVMAKQRAVRLSHDPVALAAAVRGLGQGSYDSMWESVGEIELPVLLMTGAEDATYTAHADRLAELMPRAERAEIAGAGHAVHVSDPDAAVAAAFDFIARL